MIFFTGSQIFLFVFVFFCVFSNGPSFYSYIDNYWFYIIYFEKMKTRKIIVDDELVQTKSVSKAKTVARARWTSRSAVWPERTKASVTNVPPHLTFLELQLKLNSMGKATATKWICVISQVIRGDVFGVRLTPDEFDRVSQVIDADSLCSREKLFHRVRSIIAEGNK